MENRWSDKEAGSFMEKVHGQGVGADLACRLYTTRLLGADKGLVMHGGGNTSVKMRESDLFGEEQDVIYIKGSGRSMATMQVEDMPAFRLAPLQRLRRLREITDRQLLAAQQAARVDYGGPEPSVELLLHAFLPHKFIDHTHAGALLSLTNQEDGAERCRRLFGDRVGIVPYMRPGFGLAVRAMEIFEGNPQVEGLILLQHGIFTFGRTAKEAYLRMVDLVTLARQAVGEAVAASAPEPFPVAVRPPAEQGRMLSLLRGVLRNHGDGQPVVLSPRMDGESLRWAATPELATITRQGVATPDHIIHTGFYPLVLDEADPSLSDSALRRLLADKVEEYRHDRLAWFEKHAGGGRQDLPALSPDPRVVIIPGTGIVGVGPDLKRASMRADIAVFARDIIREAGQVGAFRSISEKDAFAMETWSLEQAKLGRNQPLDFAGQVVVITGGAGAIGAATAAAFHRAGAGVAILDLDEEKAADLGRRLGGIGLGCDVTDRAAVRESLNQVVLHYGGIDVVVSNAGRARQGIIGEIATEDLRREFDINFFSHQIVAQAALEVFRRQDFGGQILFNISKQAINPGPNFGAYGLPKAATLFLMRQYAVDHSREGIRVNGVNADRIRSGLLTNEMIKNRSSARGLSEKDYMSGNLLGVEVTADDVAEAFVYLAGAEKTTGCVITVDGGNINAVLR